jgi:hypothetical protein
MGLAIRRASLTEDRQLMLGLFQKYFGGDNYARRFEWFWMLNPAGVGWTWLIYECGSNHVVGTTTLFPRLMYVDGKPVTAGQVMFFGVDAGHRSLGPAVMLQRATFEPVDSGELAFCYDCPPHDEGMSTFVRIGMRPNCEMVRYAFPLRSDEYFEKRLGTSVWAKPLIATTNLLLGMRMAKRRTPGLEISLFDGTFGDEFSHLDSMVSRSGVIRANRSADVLNWRFRQDPEPTLRMKNGNKDRYQTLVARRAGELVAFLVFLWETDTRVIIDDLFGTQLAEAGATLLEATVEVCRSQDAQCVAAYSVPGSELSSLLEHAGFRQRERAARVVAYEKPDGRDAKHLAPDLRWAFSQVELAL